MRRREFIAAIGLAVLVSMAACSPDSTPTDAVSKCIASNFASYNEKDREQCIAACIKCKKGVTTTCATACSLKGAR